VNVALSDACCAGWVQSLKRLLDDVEEVLPYFANMTVGTE
jgi:hypothetical protein